MNAPSIFKRISLRRCFAGSVRPGRCLLTSAYFLFSLIELPGSAVLANGQAEHVVVVSWDGLRPDFVNEKLTPTLYQLARDGVFFQNHHAAYPSSTKVNGAVLATGSYPARNGILANREYRPEIDPLTNIETDSLDTVRKGDQLTQGQYLQLSTLAEILQSAGHITAIAGTKPVVLLHDRAERTDTARSGVNVFAGMTLPRSESDRIAQRLSKFPPMVLPLPNTPQDTWTTRSLVESLWADSVPTFSLLWLSEPDYSQHAFGPGSKKALAALKSSDQNLERVLKALEEKGVRDKTDIFVVSDHGFSTISRGVDVAGALKKEGFKAVRKFSKPPGLQGEDNDNIMVVGTGGGSVLLYVMGHDLKLIKRLVAFFQQQDFTGVVFTRQPMRGTFTLDQIRLDKSYAPDIVLSLRWASKTNQSGAEGTLVVDTAGLGLFRGSHGSLSRFDMRATMVASGPDFRQGMLNQLPSGNADVAPTILWLLGVNAPQPMDGRVLKEAMVGNSVPPGPIEARMLEATQEHPNSLWYQYLRLTKFDGALYFQEANGTSTPK